MELYKIMPAITAEYIRAKEKHPYWPKDIIHQVSIMNEEAGEAIRAALNHVYEGQPIEEIEKELIQAGAMVLRCLENLRSNK